MPVTRASRQSLNSAALSLRFAAGQGARGCRMDGGATARMLGFVTFDRKLQCPPTQESVLPSSWQGSCLVLAHRGQAPPASEVAPSI